MEQHKIELPKIVFIGKSCLGKIEEICNELNLSGKPLIITGTQTRNIAGSFIFESLKEMEPVMKLVNRADYGTAKKITESLKNIGFVIGVGGGKNIDMGKLIAFLTNKPFISVPTAPSHDGIASDRVSINRENKKHSIKAKPPVAILADIDVIMSAPYKMIASGCADIISNYTAVYDWELAKNRTGEYYSEYAASLSRLSAKIVLRSAKIIKRKTERGIRNLMEALVTSGISMSLSGSSRPASGSEHMFSHALDFLGSSAMHGEQCGVGTIIMAYLQGRNWSMIKSKLMEIGAPVNANGLNVTEKMIVDAVLMAKNIRKRYTILDEVSLTRERAKEVCKRVGVI